MSYERSMTINLIFPSLTYRKMVLGYFFSTNNFLCRGEREKKFTYTANAKMSAFSSRRNGKRLPANVENGGKIMVTWSYVMLNLSNNVTKCPQNAAPQVRINSCINRKLNITLTFTLTLLYAT